MFSSDKSLNNNEEILVGYHNQNSNDNIKNPNLIIKKENYYKNVDNTNLTKENEKEVKTFK